MAMWQPPAKILHPLPPARWPSRAEAERARWFQSVDVGPVRLPHRTWIPAMVPWRASESGEVTPKVLAWYERFARGRPGALVVEATGIRDVASGPLLRIGEDRFIPGLAQLVDVVRRASDGHTRLFIQLIDFLALRRRPEPGKYLGKFLAIRPAHQVALGLAPDAPDTLAREALGRLDPDALRAVLDAREWEALERGHRERVTDTHLPHIARLPAELPVLFAEAANRAREAGFSGVELHYAHAYTMASFLSRTNDRMDGYGGSVEGRLRLPLEVYAAVRARVGPELAVGCRYLADETTSGGSGVEDAMHYGVAFARAGMDFLSLSRGGKFDDAAQPKVGEAAYPYTGPSGYECMPTVRSDAAGPFGRNTAATRAVRLAVRGAGYATPIVACGGIGTFDHAEALLADGTADIVAAARQSLADPDWFAKIRSGRGNEVRRCLYTNYCEALDQQHREVTCQLWDRVAPDDPHPPLTADGKRRLLPPPWPNPAIA